jgi:ligand-binding sensor domain-containing protein/serine phosphatase RsbU (regulator of sigma subunit)
MYARHRWTWLACLLTLFMGWAQAKAQGLSFTHLTVEQGLSNANVNCFWQDREGFMWVGTDDGLNRYEGHGFRVFRREPGNPYGLPTNDVKFLYGDPDGFLWVAGPRFGHLSRYDPRTERFEAVKPLREAQLVNLVPDGDGHLWAVQAGKLLRIDRRTLRLAFHDSLNQAHTFRHLVAGNRGEIWLLTTAGQVLRFHPPSRRAWLAANLQAAPGLPTLQQLHVDPQDQLWLTFRDQPLGRVVPQQGYRTYPHNPRGVPTAPSDDQTLCFASQGPLLYLGTEAQGLSVLDTRTGRFRHYPPDPANPKSPATASVHALYLDRQGRLWVGAFGGGICLADPLGQRFDKADLPLPNPTVNAILQDRRGRLWVGTEGGLAVREGGRVRQYVHTPTNPRGLRSNPVLSLAEDQQGRVWVGTWNGGLHRYDERADAFVNYSPDSPGKSPISDNKIVDLCVQQPTGQLMATTYFNGFNVMTAEGQFRTYRHDPSNPASLSHNMGSRVYQDPKGQVWVGTEKGLNRFDPASGTFERFLASDEVAGSLSNDYITSLHTDRQGRLWVGTAEGLHRRDANGKFRPFGVAQGLPNNYIHAILEDQRGRLWISTNNGLARYDPDQQVFANYDEADGLPGKQFKSNACFQSADGMLYFGGLRGLCAFHPDSIRDNPHLPPVVFTGFRLFNRPVAIGGRDSVLRQAVHYQGEVTLNHLQSIFSVDFVALNFTQPHKNRYAYRLVPLEQAWNQVGSNQRTATYTSLPPGDYTLEVRAANNDGQWNQAGAKLRLHILPPWWATWWFRGLGLGLFLSSGIIFYLVRTRFLKRQNKRLENMVALRTTELRNTNDELKAIQEELQQNMEELETSQEQLRRQNSSVEAAFAQLNLQNTRVRDSIRYAERIQRAILPHEEVLQKAFAEYLVIHRPKDVVSGDFYWYHETEPGETAHPGGPASPGTLKFLAVVDCTGHGVPGAFMSMIGNTMLNEIVGAKQIYAPHLVLEELHQGIVGALNKRNSFVQDGMDVALCCIWPAQDGQVLVQYSGAKRPLSYLSGAQLHEVPANRQSIGQALAHETYTSHELWLRPGDVLYMATDGWTDAISPGRTRFGSPRFRQMLREAAHLPLAAQKKIFCHQLEEYEQGAEQRDDVLMLGVRL